MMFVVTVYFMLKFKQCLEQCVSRSEAKGKLSRLPKTLQGNQCHNFDYVSSIIYNNMTFTVISTNTDLFKLCKVNAD